jgi:hypothetical protein
MRVEKCISLRVHSPSVLESVKKLEQSMADAQISPSHSVKQLDSEARAPVSGSPSPLRSFRTVQSSKSPATTIKNAVGVEAEADPSATSVSASPMAATSKLGVVDGEASLSSSGHARNAAAEGLSVEALVAEDESPITPTDPVVQAEGEYKSPATLARERRNSRLKSRGLLGSVNAFYGKGKGEIEAEFE